MLDVLTPLAKCHRVSRLCDPDNLVAQPGLWVDIQADGSIANITTSTPSKVCKMIMTSASDNMYESHDIESGRITTLEMPYGARFKVDSSLFVDTTIAAGDDLVVAVDAGNEGKLANEADAGGAQAGDYAVVARCEVYDSVNGTIECVLVSPRTVTLP